MPELDIEEFLRPEDVGAEVEVKIVDAGKAGTIRQGEGQEDVKTFEIGVTFPSGEKRIWTMNKTSQRTLASVWGKNTDAWVGKVAKLFTTDQNVRGTMKKIVYARTPQGA